MVSVDENVLGLRILLENLPIGLCPSFDVDSSGGVTVDELVTSVADLLYGCGIRPTHTPTSSPTRTHTITRTPTRTPTRTETSTPIPTPTQTPGLGGTWIEDNFRLISSSCPSEVNDALRSQVTAVFPCQYEISVAGDRAMSTDCGGNVVEWEIDSSGVARSTIRETESQSGCTVTVVGTFSVDLSRSPTIETNVFDVDLQGRCTIRDCRLTIETTWTRGP